MKKSLKAIVGDLKSFTGNARACILVEPLWGIPYNLFVPYASLYMMALGVSVKQIGCLAALSMILQMFWSLTAGWITDRFGRKKTSLIFDMISWSLPTLIWTFARSFTWFLVAAVLASLVRIVHVSWTCLFIEDAPKDARVRLYAWIAVAGTLSGFFAPLAGLLVGKMGLVSATRILYFFAFVMMTLMFVLRNAWVTETSIGLVKMEEAKTKTLMSSLVEYKVVFKALIRSRAAIVAFFLAVLSNIHLMVRNNFLSVILTNGIGLSPSMIAVFPPLASAVTLAAYFLLIPRIKNMRKALFLSIICNVIGNLLLFFSPQGSVFVVILGTFAVALGTGVTGPVIDAVLANSVEDSSRAVALSFIYTLMFAFTAPFGWLSGQIAAAGARLPALLAAAIMVCAALLTPMVDGER